MKAKDELTNAISVAESNSLVFVFGPTGVGKATLLQKTEQVITAELLNELQEDYEKIPVVSIEAVAPESGNFDWRDHYKRLLRQLTSRWSSIKWVGVPRADPSDRAAASCLDRERLHPITEMRWNRPSGIAALSL